MSVKGTNTSYLQIADDLSATAPHFDNIWVNPDATGTQRFILQTGANATDANGSRSLYLNGTPSTPIARHTDTDGTARNTSTATTYSASAWQALQGYFTATAATVYFDGTELATSATGSAIEPLGYTRVIGTLASGGAGTANINIAEFSRWDISGFSAAQITSLAARLATLVGGYVVNPLTVNDDPGEPWNGKLLHYFTFLDDNADGITDKVTGTLAFTKNGTPTFTAGTHPTVSVYDPPIPAITSISDEPIEEGTNYTLTGTDFKPVGTTAPTVDWGGEAQTVGTNSDTSITVTPVLGANLYGVAYGLNVSNESGFTSEGEFAASMIPANPNPATTTGERYVNVTETPATAGLRITATPDIAIGSQIHWKNAIEDTGGTPTAIDIDEIVIYGDGSISITTPGSRTFPISVDVRVNNDDGNGWSAFVTQTITAGSGDNPSLVGSDTVNLLYIRGESGVFDLSGLVSSGSWSWSINSGSLPIGWTLNASTGVITPVEVNPGSYGPAVIRVTGDTTYVDLNVSVEVFHKDNPGIASRKNQRRLRQQAAMRPKIIADYDTLVSGLESLEGQNLYKDIEA